MGSRFLVLLSACLAWLALLSPVWAWEIPVLPESMRPECFITVDKASQRLTWSAPPLGAAYGQLEWACSTGQQSGDKWREGDKKTPEGVYFLTNRRSGLDEGLYGNLAFPLNYPNPVDRIQGKTGYGIWLHGRGKDLVPRDTRGCIALRTPVLRRLASRFALQRTPVFVGRIDSPTGISPRLARIAQRLKQRVQTWAKAWEEQHSRFFTLYEPAKFDRSDSLSFAEFKAQKKQLFNRYAWIEVELGPVTALPGPGYWVTVFTQTFRSPEYTDTGLKRLYWQKDSEQCWRIVGREWIPAPISLEPCAVLVK